MKIPFEVYIASNNEKAVAALLSKYRIPAPTSPADLVRKLQFAMAKFKDVVFTDLKAIETPYKALILSGKKELTSGACGCSGVDGDTTSSCDGGCKCGSEKSNFVKTNAPIKDLVTSSVDGDGAVASKTETKIDKISDLNKYVPVVIGASLAVIAIALIAKK